MIEQKPIVLVTEPLADAPMAWLRSRGEVIEASSNSETFQRHAAAAVALVVRTYTRVDADLLAQLPKLRVVGRAGVGVDNIDLESCRARGVTVVHTPDANTQAVVEYVSCLILDALRPRRFIRESLALSAWESLRGEVVAVRQMSELTLGILGCGRIGRRLAEVGTAIGFRVIFHDLLEIPQGQSGGALAVSLAALFRESDVLSIHIDGRPSNRAFVGSALLETLPKTALVINTSRGMVLQSDALAKFLLANPAARAILDVHDPEPFTADHPLIGLANASLAPHLASRTQTAVTNMSWVVRDVMGVIEGRQPQHPAARR